MGTRKAWMALAVMASLHGGGASEQNITPLNFELRGRYQIRRVRDRFPPLLVHGELLLYHISGTSRLRRVFLPPVDAGGSTIEHLEGFMSFDFARNRLGFR